MVYVTVMASRDETKRLEAIATERGASSPPAHDFLHVMRVTANAKLIAAAEGADAEIVVPAALLHELFNYPKGHPDSHLSGEFCAEQVRGVLFDQAFEASRVERICYCIRVHGFSRGVIPNALEARVLQDADRLDAIGAIGIARCFATCTEMGRPFYSPMDPFCLERPPDDRRWGLDHFYKKLLRISEGLHTRHARKMAEDRMLFMREFLAQLRREIEHGHQTANAG